MKSDVVRKIGFTGSTAVGKILMKQAADTVKKARHFACSPFPGCAWRRVLVPCLPHLQPLSAAEWCVRT